MKKKNVCVVIPARLNSERFPNKLLAEYQGKPIIAWSFIIGKIIAEVIAEAYGGRTNIVLATDVLDEELESLASYYGIEYFFMNKKVSCGSERVQRVYLQYPKYDYYVSIPADEPSAQPYEVAASLRKAIDFEPDAISTAWCHFYNEEDLLDNKSCKIMTDQHHNILYTSRAVIPGTKSGEMHDLRVYKKHYGMFVFPRKVLKKYHHSLWYNMELNPNHPASLEGLEQNMFIRRDVPFRAVQIVHHGFGIDSPEQLKKLEDRFNNQK